MEDKLKSQLIWLMRSFHCGNSKAIKKRELLIELYGPYAIEDESYNNAYDRTLRAAIEEP